MAVAGISIISWKGENSLLMLINASIAGTGYGLFSVLVKKFKLNGGLFLTKYLLLFGSVYLAVPFLVNLHSINFNSDIILGLIGLAVLPTILGFFCTTKALSYMSAAKVQVTELSEPIFAALMAWVLFMNSQLYRFYMVRFLLFQASFNEQSAEIKLADFIYFVGVVASHLHHTGKVNRHL